MSQKLPSKNVSKHALDIYTCECKLRLQTNPKATVRLNLGNTDVGKSKVMRKLTTWQRRVVLLIRKFVVDTQKAKCKKQFRPQELKQLKTLPKKIARSKRLLAYR